jgi:hypothetical protein
MQRSGSKGGGRGSSGGGADTGGSALSVSALTEMVLQLHPDMEDAGEHCFFNHAWHQ